MKSTLRKGFTLVELLFVMAIISILAGFAIANLKDSSRTATITSMKNDARNAIAVQQTYFAENQNYVEVDSATAGVTNGKVTGTNFTVSDRNNLRADQITCDNNTVGYSITVSNAQYGDTVTFDSCNDGKIQLNPPARNPVGTNV